MKNLRPEDIDEKFMDHNGVSKINGMKCRTDLEQFVRNIPAAVKGALDDIDDKFREHNGISKLCGAKCWTDKVLWTTSSVRLAAKLSNYFLLVDIILYKLMVYDFKLFLLLI